MRDRVVSVSFICPRCFQRVLPDNAVPAQKKGHMQYAHRVCPERSLDGSLR